jgi:hypothetical protein
MFDLPRLARNRRPIFLPPIIATKGQAAELSVILAAALQPLIAATPRIMATYTPSPLRVDAPADTEAVLRDVEGEINVLLLSIGPRIRQWAVRIERWHRQRWTQSIYSATNVDLRTIMTGTAVQESLDAFIARNVALAKDIPAEAQRRIADAVYRGYQARLPAREVAAEIRKAHDMGKKRALRVAGDQNSKLSAALDKERQLEAGIRYGQYRHSGKKHPRVWHQARNGKIYNLRTRQEVDPKTLKPKAGGDRIPAEDWPGYPPFCGCRMGSWLPIMAELDDDA